MESANKKPTVSQLYKAAQKRGYRNSYGAFAEIYNRHRTEQLSKKDLEAGENYLNDKGKGVAPEDQEPIVRTMPGVNRDQGPAPAPTPTPAPATPVVADDKIFGMNKYLFFGLAVLSVIAIGTASVWLYRNYVKRTSAPAPVPAAAVAAQAAPPVVAV